MLKKGIWLLYVLNCNYQKINFLNSSLHYYKFNQQLQVYFFAGTTQEFASQNFAKYCPLNRYVHLYASNSFSTLANFTHSANSLVASLISSKVGKDGAIRMLESFGSFLYG